ncbi:hypothetical protein ASE02_00005 [Phenylobacterium sp. Root700]|nr:hypothetical protein ASE02_00005 [Phenylobacterium sp. Root700]
MWMDTACDALAQGKVLELQYSGYSRCVEVHAVGISTKGNLVMRVWQIRGGSVSGEAVGWKLMNTDDASGAVILDEGSQAPRPGYKPGDRGMSSIRAEL